MADQSEYGRLQARGEKAPEGWSTPRRFALKLIGEPRVSVLECGGPPPLSAPGLSVFVLTETASHLLTQAARS